jgi:hypothetical protein
MIECEYSVFLSAKATDHSDIALSDEVALKWAMGTMQHP